MVIVKNETGRGARAAAASRPHKKVYTFNLFFYFLIVNRAPMKHVLNHVVDIRVVTLNRNGTP